MPVICGLFAGYFMVISRLFHGYFTVISWLFHGYFTVISRLFHGYFTVILRLCYDVWQFDRYLTRILEFSQILTDSELLDLTFLTTKVRKTPYMVV